MSTIRTMDRHLFLAVMQVAREECAHGHWDDLAPLLQTTWESLREEGTPPWETVAEEIQESCRSSGYVH
jgi:hypothetical protein